MKITYRPIDEKDLEDRVKWYADKDVAQFFGPEIRFGTTLEKQKEWFQKTDADDRQDFIIEVDGKSVGSVGVIEINKIDKNAGMYIYIGDKNFWRKGIATDAIKFIKNIVFNDLGLHKLWLHVYEPNTAAIECYKKNGFEIEARHREMVSLDGKYYDEMFMTLTNPND